MVALQRQFDRYTAGFGLHYVDCGSYTAHTLAGRAFLMTNVPFLFAGSRLASSAGQIGMGLSIALAGLLSHSYHARQLRYAGVEPEETAEGAEVRLAMMCDYGGALTAAVAGMATIAKRGGIALLRANPMLPLTVTAANACFVGGCGPLEAREYLIVHGMAPIRGLRRVAARRTLDKRMIMYASGAAPAPSDCARSEDAHLATDATNA